MFEVGWSEIIIVAVVALVVVGPKDLPLLLRTIGRYAGEAKRYLDAFRSQFDEVVRKADLDLVRKEMNDVRAAVDMEIAQGRNGRMEADHATNR